MLGPHRFHPSDRDEAARQLGGRATWQLVADGALRERALQGPALERAWERLWGCSVVVGRRRHGSFFGPIVGLVVSEDLRRTRAVEALCFEAPREDQALSRWIRDGLAMVDMWVRFERRRHERPAVQIVWPDGLDVEVVELP